jgi:hypothetical protein
MKYSILSLLILSLTTTCFGGEPTSAEPTISVEIVENTGTNVVCSDCNIRRRNIVRNGYVITNHELTNNSVSTTRSLIDNRNNTVRSRTVTKNFCNNGKCKILVK